MGGSDDSLDAAIRRADLMPRIAVHTLDLTEAFHANAGNYTRRMQTVIGLLQADAALPESLLDLSHTIEGCEVSSWTDACSLHVSLS